MTTEADTCRKYVLPKLYAAGWNDDQISEQRTFTDGRIMVAGTKVWRRTQKRADYLLRYRSSLMLAVVEAKAFHKNPGDGLQQAKEYAQSLDLKFAYATNGHGIVECAAVFDFIDKSDYITSPDFFGWQVSPRPEKVSFDDSDVFMSAFLLAGVPFDVLLGQGRECRLASFLLAVFYGVFSMGNFQKPLLGFLACFPGC